MDLLETALRRLMQAAVVGGLVIAAFLPARGDAQQVNRYPARHHQTDETHSATSTCCSGRVPKATNVSTLAAPGTSNVRISTIGTHQVAPQDILHRVGYR